MSADDDELASEDVLRRGVRRMRWSFALVALVIVSPVVGFLTLGREGGLYGMGVSILIMVVAVAQYANAPGHRYKGPRNDDNARF